MPTIAICLLTVFPTPPHTAPLPLLLPPPFTPAQTIHKTRVPIIAICNDKYSTKLKSLRNHTLELDYRK